MSQAKRKELVGHTYLRESSLSPSRDSISHLQGAVQAPPLLEIDQSAAAADYGGRGQTAVHSLLSSDASVCFEGARSERAAVPISVSDTGNHRTKVHLPDLLQCGTVTETTECSVREVPVGEVVSVSRSGNLSDGAASPVLFRPYSDHVNTSVHVGEYHHQSSGGVDSVPATVNNPSGQRPPGRVTDNRGTATTSDICGAAAEADGGDGRAICGASEKLAGCSRSRPVSVTWGRYRDWYRRRKQQQQLAAAVVSDVRGGGRGCSSDVTGGGRCTGGDVTQSTMMSLGGVSAISGAASASAAQAADARGPPPPPARGLLSSAAAGGKLIGIAKARQREPDVTIQHQQQQHQQQQHQQHNTAVLGAVNDRLAVPGLAGGSVWAGSGRDMGVASWSVGGASAAGPAPSVWLGQPPQYTAAPLYASYPQSFQLHSDPNTGHWMLVPRPAEPVQRPAVLWSPYQCLSQQQPQQLVLPPQQQQPQQLVLPPQQQQPQQLFLQPAPAAADPSLLTRSGANTNKKEEAMSRLKPIQPAPAVASAVAPAVASVSHSQPLPPPPMPVQYIIPAPLQSVYYTHTEPPPFIIQPQPPQQHLPAANAAGLQQLVTQMPVMPLVTPPEPPPPPPPPPPEPVAASPQPAGPTGRQIHTRSQGTSPLNPEEDGFTPHETELHHPQLSETPGLGHTSSAIHQSPPETASPGNQSPADSDPTQLEIGQSEPESDQPSPLASQLESAVSPTPANDSPDQEQEVDVSEPASPVAVQDSSPGSPVLVIHEPTEDATPETPSEAPLTEELPEEPSNTPPLLPPNPLSLLAQLAADALPLAAEVHPLTTEVHPLTTEAPSPVAPHLPESARLPSVESESRYSSAESRQLSTESQSRLPSTESDSRQPSAESDSNVTSVDPPAGLHLLCEALAVQQLRAGTSLTSLLTAVQLLVPTQTTSSPDAHQVAPRSLSALCTVAGEELARVPVFYVPPKWQLAVRHPVDPAGNREYGSRQRAERAREWLRKRAAGPTAEDQMQVSFTIEPFWEESARVQQIRGQLRQLQRLYKAQLQLQRSTSPRKRSRSPGQKRSRGRGRPVGGRPVAVAPAPAPVVTGSDSDGESSPAARGGSDEFLWEDTASADTVSYCFSSRQDANYTNGIRALAECKRRRLQQTTDPEPDAEAARKKRKLCPPKKHCFSPDDTETIVAKKKSHPTLKPKLKPTLKAELRTERSEPTSDDEVRSSSPPQSAAVVPQSRPQNGTPPQPAPRRTTSKPRPRPCNSRPAVSKARSRSTSQETAATAVAGPTQKEEPTPAGQSVNKTAAAVAASGQGLKKESVAMPASDPAKGQGLKEEEGLKEEAATAETNGTVVQGQPRLSAADLSSDIPLLVLIDGLFYRSVVRPVQPPDLYAVTVEGERCHRPYIYTQEELLTQAVREVRPASFLSLVPGTRVTANWSPKLRGLFPGTVTEGATAVAGMLYVEFDDGDSGYMRLEGIRLLPPDYPTVEHDQDPLDTLHRWRRRRASSGASSQRTGSRLSVQEEVPRPSTADERPLTQPTPSQADRPASVENGRTAAPPAASPEAVVGVSRQRRTQKKKRRRCTDEGYTVEQATGLKIRIKSPSPTRRRDSAPESSPARKRSGETNARKKKASERQRHSSGMAAFLPERQLWDWEGRGVRRAASKGKAKRVVYTGISRGLEHIAVGDCAVFLSAGLPERPYVGRIHALWEATSGQMLVQVAWFYHPEETVGLQQPLSEPKGALFESGHMDENDVQTISHRCQVLTLEQFKHARPTAADYEAFYRAGAYDPTKQTLTFEEGVLV